MNSKLANTHKFLATPKTGDGRIYFHPIFMMHAARQYGKTYSEFMQDYRVLVDSNMKLLEMYDHDAVSVISDSYREASAFGAKITFDGDSSPKVDKLITSMADVEKLEIPDVYSCVRTLDRIEGVRLFREKLGNPFPIIGWVEGPLAESADLSGVSELLMNMIMEPDMVKALQQKCLQMAKDFALAQIKAGSNIMGVGDAVCSQISQDMYDEFCLPLHRELFKFIHDNGAIVKLHICGDITHILPSLAKTDVDILDVDWMVDMAEAHKSMGDGVMVCGNIDPVTEVLEGTEASIKSKFDAIKASVPVENWIFMAGCEIPRDSPVGNVRYMREISMKK